MTIKTRIKSKIYSLLVSHFQKRGIKKAVKEFKKSIQTLPVDIPKLIIDINTIISRLKDEVDVYKKAMDLIEIKYPQNEKASEIATIFPFVNLSMLDILSLHKQFLSTEDISEKNFICRTAALHMYEFLEDVSKILGKQISFFETSLNNQVITTMLYALRKSFNELKSEFHLPLKKIRNNVSGHKDRNIKNQLEVSNSINAMNFHKNFALFLIFFSSFLIFRNAVVDEIYNKQQNI